LTKTLEKSEEEKRTSSSDWSVKRKNSDPPTRYLFCEKKNTEKRKQEIS